MSTSVQHHPTSQNQPGKVRLLLPAVLIIIWLALSGVGGASFGAISGLAENDRAAFLPDSAESTRVQERLGEFLGGDLIPAIVVLESEHPLDEQTVASLQHLTTEITEHVGVDTSPVIPSEDGMAAQVVALLPEGADPQETVDKLTEVVDGSEAVSQAGLESWVTGPAGFSADLSDAFAGIDGTLLLVAIIAVFVILVVVYRSPLLPVLVMFSALSALALAVFINVQLARLGWVTINGQVQGILFILVIGAATDYSLLYIARFRELLREQPSAFSAAVRAVRGTIEPIAASAGTVIAGLLCLLLSDLGNNAALGPVAAVGIACAVLASLTFLPALLAVAGRAAFWPRRPLHGSGRRETSGGWARIGELIDARPRTWAAGVLAFLILGCLGLPLLNATGVPQSEFVLGESQARDGQEVLDRHFPGGSGSPTYVIVDESSLSEAAEAAPRVDGVESVAVTAQGDRPTAPVIDGVAEAPAVVVDGDVLLQLTLADPADSSAAGETVKQLREQLPEGALVGGESAVDLDTNETSIRDTLLIIPIVLIVITAMLALLLRSLVAPVVLLLTTVLSFGTALGISAVIFRLIGFEGSDPSVPLYGFIFLVALGIDYNIFLMSRVREESLEHGTHRGMLRGLALTGGVITSAGVVLAATFAALGVIPIQFLAQLAIIVTLGVLIDALIVRSFFVPALTLLVGDRMWWPWHRRMRQAA